MRWVAWVVTDKGSFGCPEPKARLVTSEFVSDRETLIFLVRLLPIARNLISGVATMRSSRRKPRMMLLDVAAAFLYGFSERLHFFEISKEDPAAENPRLVARLVRVLYATRDTLQLWNHVGGKLREIGCQETFAQCLCSPGSFFIFDVSGAMGCQN